MNWIERRKKLLQLASRRTERGAREPPGSSGSPSSLHPPGPAPPAWPDLARARALASTNGNGVDTGAAPAPDHGDPGPDLPGPEVQGPLPRVVPPRRATSLCVASGKGGTGKSVVTASLASLLGLRGRTLVVDADLGVGNAHILQDVSPAQTLVDVVEGDRSVPEVVVPCSDDVDLVGAGSGVPRMADLSAYELHLIAAGLEALEDRYRFLLVDSAAGVSQQTLTFAAACDLTLLVTTPDLTAMTDAYAFLKVLVAKTRSVPLLLVNRARDEEQAQEVFERIRRVGQRFLETSPVPIGWLPEDPAVGESVNRRGAVVDLAPEAPASRALRRHAVTLVEELGRREPQGIGRRLVGEVGFARGLG